MKNEIIVSQDYESKLYAASLWSYEETPSGSIRPILRVLGRAIFLTPNKAAWDLFDMLKTEVRENTTPPNLEREK